jgi:cytochrome c oxidase subunit 1
MFSERLGRLSFALTFIGFNVTFFPMHQLGLEGMPRRIYTYEQSLGWGGLNLLSSLGAAVLILGGVVFLYNIIRHARHGAVADADPWGADTLEWSTTSPPPSFNFVHIPAVQGRYPRWMRREPEVVVVGLSPSSREVLVSEVMDAEPMHVETVSAPTIWTFWTALATSALLMATMFTPWGLPLGALPLAFTATMWFRAGLPPRREYPPDPQRLAEPEKVA